VVFQKFYKKVETNCIRENHIRERAVNVFAINSEFTKAQSHIEAVTILNNENVSY